MTDGAAPVIVYMRHGSRGESTLDYAAGSDDPLRFAYRVAADMIETNSASPEAIIFRGETHTMDDLAARYGPWYCLRPPT